MAGRRWLRFVALPLAWEGLSSSTHPHLWAAVYLGGVVVSLPIFLALAYPGAAITRHTVAVAQMRYSALLIHPTGGRSVRPRRPTGPRVSSSPTCPTRSVLR